MLLDADQTPPPQKGALERFFSWGSPDNGPSESSTPGNKDNPRNALAHAIENLAVGAAALGAGAPKSHAIVKSKTPLVQSYHADWAAQQLAIAELLQRLSSQQEELLTAQRKAFDTISRQMLQLVEQQEELN